MKKKIAFFTLGCKVNQYETDSIEQQFKGNGYDIVSFDEKADVYIINTCTVTNIADKKSRQMIHKAKKLNEQAIVVAVGCYVQAAKEVLEKDRDIDILVGNNNKSDVFKIVEEHFVDEDVKDYVLDLSEQREYEDLFLSRVEEKTRVFIKIQDGCNQFCSYCIIPYTRGRIRSREPRSVIHEVEEIVGNGYKEVVLTGIHLASYGYEFDEYRLVELLEDLNAIEGLERIRLGSLEPTLVTEEFVTRISVLERVCPHFHLSLQSGCDTVLERMNRKYTTQAYSRAVELLRTYFEKPSITTDIIVGFPGETDDEFRTTCDFVETIKFADVHVFKYSVREGTKAAAMPNQVQNHIKSERSKKLIAIKKKLHETFLKNYIGENVTVLFENEHIIQGQNYYIGHTMNYLKVGVLKEERNLENRVEDVKVSKMLEDVLL